MAPGAEPFDGLGFGVVGMMPVLPRCAAAHAWQRFGVCLLCSGVEPAPRVDPGVWSDADAASLGAEAVTHEAHGLAADDADWAFFLRRRVGARLGAEASIVSGVGVEGGSASGTVEPHGADLASLPGGPQGGASPVAKPLLSSLRHEIRSAELAGSRGAGVS